MFAKQMCLASRDQVAQAIVADLWRSFMSGYEKKEDSPVTRIRGFTAALAYLLITGFPVQVLAQDGDCNINYIYLTSQTKVDNFQADYGPCSRVIGDLYIEDYDPVDDITDLSLIELRSRRSLTIYANLY
jgi:hypothetical protein